MGKFCVTTKVRHVNEIRKKLLGRKEYFSVMHCGWRITGRENLLCFIKRGHYRYKINSNPNLSKFRKEEKIKERRENLKINVNVTRIRVSNPRNSSEYSKKNLGQN